jgi:hypothetical protein
MSKSIKTILPERVFTLVLLVFCGMLFYAATWSSWASSKIKDSRSKQIEKLDRLRDSLRVGDLKVSNKTQHLYIVSIEKKQDNQILISLRNDYAKKITSYELSMGSKLTLVDYKYSDHEDGISPGNVVEELQTIDIDPELSEKGIAILAVLFEDGTSDGDPAHIQEIVQYRLGGKMQLERALLMLEKVKARPRNEISAELARIKADLNSSRDQDSALPQYVKFGINDAKMMLSREIESLSNHLDDGAESQINSIIEKYRQINSKSLL